jgi:hypothetical protein
MHGRNLNFQKDRITCPPNIDLPAWFAHPTEALGVQTFASAVYHLGVICYSAAATGVRGLRENSPSTVLNRT